MKILLNNALCRCGGPQSENQRKLNEMDLAENFKKLWNMKVTVILIVIPVKDHQLTMVGKTYREY